MEDEGLSVFVLNRFSVKNKPLAIVYYLRLNMSMSEPGRLQWG